MFAADDDSGFTEDIPPPMVLSGISARFCRTKEILKIYVSDHRWQYGAALRRITKFRLGDLAELTAIFRRRRSRALLRACRSSSLKRVENGELRVGGYVGPLRGVCFKYDDFADASRTGRHREKCAASLSTLTAATRLWHSRWRWRSTRRKWGQASSDSSLGERDERLRSHSYNRFCVVIRVTMRWYCSFVKQMGVNSVLSCLSRSTRRRISSIRLLDLFGRKGMGSSAA